jgi:hypothetical protein
MSKRLKASRGATFRRIFETGTGFIAKKGTYLFQQSAEKITR